MHIRNVHSESTNVVCGGCSKRFKNKESLRVHKIKYCRDPIDKTGSPVVVADAPAAQWETQKEEKNKQFIKKY